MTVHSSIGKDTRFSFLKEQFDSAMDYKKYFGMYFSLVRMTVLGSGGRWFESSYPEYCLVYW